MEDLISIVHEGKVLDMVYRRGGETPLVTAARDMGIPAVGGEEVLLYQGVEAFELFTGVSAPVDIMREALRQGREIS
jgi:shikimate dehydrogenase